MYNRYIPTPGGYTRVTEADGAGHRPPAEPAGEKAAQAKDSPLSGLLRSLKLEGLDTGDIVLLLILLLLFLEGEDTELLIALGLLLLLGLDD